MNERAAAPAKFASSFPVRAPCGPGCRFAESLRGYPDFVWCLHDNAPRSTLRDTDCPNFADRADRSPEPDRRS